MRENASRAGNGFLKFRKDTISTELLSFLLTHYKTMRTAIIAVISAIFLPVSLAFQGISITERKIFQREVVQTHGSPSLFMFGGLFGGNDDESQKSKDGDLALFTKLGESDVQFNGLSDYLMKWAKLFETDPKGMGLTTPIRLLPSSNIETTDVESFSGLRLVFQSTNTGYKSKKEEDEKSNETNNTKKKKKKEKLEGGVEVLVEKLISGTIQVRAKRCDFDEDTMIKEMSEETIIKELRKAIDVWKRETK